MYMQKILTSTSLLLSTATLLLPAIMSGCTNSQSSTINNLDDIEEQITALHAHKEEVQH